MLPDSLQEVRAAASLDERDPTAILDGARYRGQVMLVVDPGKIRDVCRFLKQDGGFQRLSSVTAVDRHPEEPRFEVVYHLHSIRGNERLRLTCRLSGDEPEIDSVIEIWRGANWYEREVADLFGIRFRGHPNPRRIMLPEDWEGHPLRKDYPIHGHKYEYGDETS